MPFHLLSHTPNFLDLNMLFFIFSPSRLRQVISCKYVFYLLFHIFRTLLDVDYQIGSVLLSLSLIISHDLYH